MYFLWSDANTSKPLSELLYAVGAWSSNVSALTLLTLTNHDALNETAHEIGMKQTYLFANPYELPYCRPNGTRLLTEDIDAAMAYVVDSYEEKAGSISPPPRHGHLSAGVDQWDGRLAVGQRADRRHPARQCYS